MARDYTPLPFEYLEEMDHLSDAEYGRLIRALQQYSITGEEAKLNGQEKAHWKRVRNREDRYRESFDASDKAKSERGAKAANARWSKAKNANVCTSIHEDACDANTDIEADTKTETESIAPPAPPRAREPETNDTSRSESPNSSPPGSEPPPDPLHDPEFGRVMTFFMDKLNPMPPSMAVDGLENYTKSLGADVVIHAMEICLGEKKSSWNYLRKILMRYEREGLRSIEAVRFQEQERDERQARKSTDRAAAEPTGGFGLVDMDGGYDDPGGLVAGYGGGW